MCVSLCVCEVWVWMHPCPTGSASLCLSVCWHQPPWMRLHFRAGQLLWIFSVCTHVCVSKNTSVSLVSILLCVCVFTGVTHCVKVECGCGGGVERWQSEGRQCFVAIWYIPPCREVTMSPHRCASMAMSVSWWGHLYPCGIRMYQWTARRSSVCCY